MVRTLVLIVLISTIPLLFAESNTTMRTIQVGQMYKHYKGALYKVIAIAVDTEAGVIDDYAKITDAQRRVLYYAVENDTIIWDRPYEMFASSIVIDGREQWRFAEYNTVPDVQK